MDSPDDSRHSGGDRPALLAMRERPEMGASKDSAGIPHKTSLM
jgi:hypothetical protein